MSRPDSIQSRMHRLVVIFCAFAAVILTVMLRAIWRCSWRIRELARQSV